MIEVTVFWDSGFWDSEFWDKGILPMRGSVAAVGTSGAITAR
jgi:hypothetical protein